VAGNWQFPKSFSQIHGHEFSQLLAATLALMSTDIQLSIDQFGSGTVY
jgi:hypothetical protein